MGLALARKNVCPAAIEIFFRFSSTPAEVIDICLKDLQLFVALLFNCTRILCQEVEYSSPSSTSTKHAGEDYYIGEKHGQESSYLRLKMNCSRVYGISTPKMLLP